MAQTNRPFGGKPHEADDIDFAVSKPRHRSLRNAALHPMQL